MHRSSPAGPLPLLLLLLAGCFPIFQDGSDLLSDTADDERDCTAHEHNGEIYDCTALDRCDVSAENTPFRVACCDCAPDYCNPVPVEECPPQSSTL